MKNFSKQSQIGKVLYSLGLLFLFILTANLALAQSKNSVSSQTLTTGDAYLISPDDGNFSGENFHEDVTEQFSIPGIRVYKWKLVGNWFNSNGIYVFDNWEPNAFGGELNFANLFKSGATTESYFSNIQTYGYGIHGRGETFNVTVACDDNVWIFYIQDYLKTGYIKTHTYVVPGL